MSIERVRKYFEENFPGVGCRILEFTESSATVSLLTVNREESQRPFLFMGRTGSYL